MSKKCCFHSGNENRAKKNNAVFKARFRNLPNSTVGEGVDKCACCAFLLGIEETIEEIEKGLGIKFPEGAWVLESRKKMIDAIKGAFDEDAYSDYIDELADEKIPRLA